MNKMTKEDIENRQGRSKKQQESNEKMMFASCCGMLVALLGIIIYGIIS